MKPFIYLSFAFVFVQNASAQYSFFEPEGSFAIEVSLDNTSLTRLPINRNAITSLAIVGDNIIGGTKAAEGLSPFIFVASIKRRELISYSDIDSIIPNQQSIVTGFHRSANNLFAGTMPQKNSSGHLLQLQTSANGISKIIDLGVPVQNEGVFSLTFDSLSGTLYGITYPSGIFFAFNIKTKQSTLYRNLVPSGANLTKLQDEFGLSPVDYLSKSLITDNKGRIYGSVPVNRIFRFDPGTRKFTLLSDSLPEVWGRNILGQAEALVKSPKGIIYGGNGGDGQLFSINPATGTVKNFGKPIMAAHIRGLAFARNGKLYGIAGALPGYAHLFSFDETAGFKDYGNPQFKMKAPGIEQGIDWRGFQLGSIASSIDGSIIAIGEDESLSQLLVFPVSRRTLALSSPSFNSRW